MKIYVASSWRNEKHGEVCKRLKEEKYEVYDFKNDSSFHWNEFDLACSFWTPERFIENLNKDKACKGFKPDWDAMQKCDIGILLLPCGKSAHLEAGYFVGAKKPLYILLDYTNNTPELMYKMATGIFTSLDTLVNSLRAYFPVEDIV